VKYSMIVATPLAADLDRHLDRPPGRDADSLTEAIRECCSIKVRIVPRNEGEGGGRAVLNYGHTVGHALEAAAGLGDQLLHGEAVSVGMRAAGLLSIRTLGCPPEGLGWQDEMIVRCGLATALRFDPELLFGYMGAYKKTVGAFLGWVLLE